MKKTLFASVAGLLSVWLSGVVFLFCCENVDAMVFETHACPHAEMSSEHHPISVTSTAVHTVILGVGECATGCPYLPVVLDKARKIERGQKQIAASVSVAPISFDQPIAAYASRRPPAYYSKPMYTNELFIINCVFRI